MLQTFIAKTVGLVRLLAPLLLGAMLPLLSLLASANAEAQTEFTPPQTTVYIKANITREIDTRPPVQPIEWTWERILSTYSPARLAEASARRCEHGIDFDNGLACRTRQDVPFPPFEDETVLRTSELCSQMGGKVGLQGRQEFCSNIDRQGTFCFVGSREVFPCRGLYKNVLRCNSINRPARNPFICERTCPEEQFACGSGCWSVNFEPTDEVFPVAPGHAGTIFAAETTLTVGTWEFAELEGPKLTLADVIGDPPSSGKSFGLTAYVYSPPLSSGSAHAGTLQMAFNCPELSSYKHYAVAEWAFTVTVLAQPPTTTLYFESGAGSGGGGRVTVNGITALIFHSGDATLFQVGEDGDISLSSPRPGDGESRTLTVLAYSPEEFLGAMRLTVQAEFRHPFHSDLGANHCRVPAASDYQALRRESCSGDAVGGYCAELDDPLFDALETDGDGGDSDFCRALRNGANVNALDSDRDYPYPMAAAAKGNSVARGEILLRDGALIRNNRAEFGNALNYAAYAGAAEFARWLIATAGAGVNAQSGPGTTPIFHARTSEMVNLLVSATANVNFIAESPPRTPLDAMLDDYDFAANAGLLQAIERLEREGALCLASFTRPRPTQVLRCSNTLSCELPYAPSSDSEYFSLCTLTCPEGYGSPSWACEGPASDFLDPSNAVDYAARDSAREQCQVRATSQESDLSCL